MLTILFLVLWFVAGALAVAVFSLINRVVGIEDSPYQIKKWIMILFFFGMISLVGGICFGAILLVIVIAEYFIKLAPINKLVDFAKPKNT